MKLLLGLGTAGYCLAQGAQPLLGELGPYAQLGAVGVLGYIAIRLLGEQKEARADSAKQREEHAHTLAAICDRFERWQTGLQEADEVREQLVRDIIGHCGAPHEKHKPAKAGGT